MPLLPRVRSLCDSLLRPYRLERELDAELRVFVEELADRYVARGMTRDAARRAALVEMGGLVQVKAAVRDVRIGNSVETTMGDVRQAWRGLWRTPAFAVITILTLGLGIGATTAIFSLVNALLLEELPYREGRQLVFVWQDLTRGGYPRAPLAGPEIQDLRRRATRVSDFGGIWSNTAVLTGDDPEQLRIGLVTSNFFSVLGASPALGRTFSAQDEASSADDSASTASRTILLSHALWQRRFGSDPSLVGRTIQVNNRATTVIGVMPEGFRLMLPPDSSVPDDLQAWLLLDSSFTQWPRGQQFLRVVGRLKPGVTLSDAQQEIATIGAQVSREQAFYGRAGLTLYAVGLHADDVREMQPTLLALFAGVGILLIVAGVNVASLLVARAAARGRETAVRVALGAGTGRLFRQYAVEGLVLGTLGGLAGLIIGRACLSMLIALRPAALSRIDTASIDPTVMAFTAGLALTWAFLLSLAPLAEVRRADVSHSLQLQLQRGARSGATGLSYRRRAVLVISQLALSVVLLVGAGLLIRAFMQLMRADPGFSSDHIVTFRLALRGPRFNSREAVNAFSMEFRSRLAALPGVTGVGAISHLPYDELPNWGTPYLREGDTNHENEGTADTRAITPGFFESVGARLLDGRLFTEADDVKTMPVTIVDELLAQRLWPGERAVGKRLLGDPLTTGQGPNVTLTVVGVVRHLRHRRPTEDIREQLYFPVRQAPRNPMAYVVRSSADANLLASQIRETLAQLDRRLPVYDVRPLSAYVGSARAARRFTMILATAFAAVALALAGIGVYGVTAYAVASRRREFGVRLALGASPRLLLQLVMSESTRLAVVGLILGLIGAGIAAALLRTQLYGITPADPISYAVAVPTLAAAVTLAAWLPARRAARVSPLESLRAE
jgi:putative ABC transport system permease protein